jgi:uncharacterized protein
MQFDPIVKNPHVLTILGNYWPRGYDFSVFPPGEARYIQTEPGVQVLVETQRPAVPPRGEVLLLHGLEGSGRSGYMISMSHHALSAGFTVHRFHMRTCGGTEHLSPTLYHAGLTSDLIAFLRKNAAQIPLFLIGFSLGGNVAIKASAEAPDLIAGTASISAPIDLARATKALNRPENRIYENRFVARMKQRLIRTGRYRAVDLAACRTVYAIDDLATAPSFGFGTADRYYETQSALRFIPQIRVPVLMITAQDDTLIPYGMYLDPAVQNNPHIQVIAPEHGGHLGFLSRTAPRFWLDKIVIDWVEEQSARVASKHPLH